MKVIEEYFDAFVNKDLERLSELYSDDVVLSEWDENVFTGKEAVLQANADLFNKFEKIGVLVKARGESGNISLNEIIVLLDDISVKVVDSITIHNEKIVYIMAYKGF
jgi:ketosteroid isomerase-like protein